MKLLIIAATLLASFASIAQVLSTTTTAPATYQPRRADWQDAATGMPQAYRMLNFSPGLKQLLGDDLAMGYWYKKPVCDFPQVDHLPPQEVREWMLQKDAPNRPFGEVYYTSPGSYIYQNTCANCHGQMADGNSAIATSLTQVTLGLVTVPDLLGGMFGNKNANLNTFDVSGQSLAGNYFLWMAMEGTKVQFPPNFSALVGKNGHQMLAVVRANCLRLITSDHPSNARYVDYELYEKLCFLENLNPGNPDLAFNQQTNLPVYPGKVEAWLDRAALNAGWAVFGYLQDAAAGKWRARIDQCELVYPR